MQEVKKKPFGMKDIHILKKMIQKWSYPHLFTYNIGVAVKNYTYPIQHAVCIHYKATTWGTAPEGIGYNYSNNKYGIDTEHKKENCASKVCDIHSNIHCGK